MNPVLVAGLIAIVGTFLLMLAALVISARCNTYRARSQHLEGLLHDVLVESLTAEEHAARQRRHALQQEYDRIQAAPFLDGGF